MHRLLLALALWSTPALALTEGQQGGWVELGGGGLLDIPVVSDLDPYPVAFAPTWSLHTGLWFGRYDEDFAIGRYHGIGVTVRQAWMRGALATIPALEYRRGVDVIVFGYHGFVQVGPQIVGSTVGVEGLGGIGAKYRFTPHWGVGVRVGAGAAWSPDAIAIRADLRVTLSWAASFQKPPDYPE